jgi:hypothetical protein
LTLEDYTIGETNELVSDLNHFFTMYFMCGCACNTTPKIVPENNSGIVNSEEYKIKDLRGKVESNPEDIKMIMEFHFRDRECFSWNYYRGRQKIWCNKLQNS